MYAKEWRIEVHSQSLLCDPVCREKNVVLVPKQVDVRSYTVSISVLSTSAWVKWNREEFEGEAIRHGWSDDIYICQTESKEVENLSEMEFAIH